MPSTVCLQWKSLHHLIEASIEFSSCHTPVVFRCWLTLCYCYPHPSFSIFGFVQEHLRSNRCSVRQGRSQTFSFGGATGGASFATKGAVNGLCRTFRKRPTERDLILGGPLGEPGKIVGGKWPPLAPPSSAPGVNHNDFACVCVWSQPGLVDISSPQWPGELS